VVGLRLRDRVMSSSIRVEPLLFCIKMSQLRWFRHQFRMPPTCLPKEVLWAYLTGKRPQGRPRTHPRNFIPLLVCELLRIPQEELESIYTERDVPPGSVSSATRPQINVRKWID